MTTTEVRGLEQRLQPIPAEARTTRVSGQFWIWFGANTAPINWVLGALGIHLGRGLRDTVVVLVAGNVIGMLLFGLFVLLGQQTGATAMVLSRAAFGRRGNYLPAAIQALLAIGWCSINTWVVLDLVVALLGQLGIADPNSGNPAIKIVTAAVLMTVQVVIALFGYRAIATFERWTVPPTIMVLAAMSVTAWFFLDVNWSYAGPDGDALTGLPRVAAMTAVMTAIGIGWGITWFPYAADYSRFVSTTVSRRRLYLASIGGQFLPVVWLGLLGASLATKNGSVDPGRLIVENYGMLAVPVLLLVIHGPIATNILNIYTFSVAAQALDINLPRRTLNVFVGAVAFLFVIVFIVHDDLATTLDSFLVGIVAWISTWGGIMLVHYHWVEPGRGDLGRLFDPVGTRRLPDINWAGMTAFFAGVTMTWMFLYGLVPELQGTIAVALGGIDLSWLAGGLTSATVYAALARKGSTPRTEEHL